MNLLRDTLGKVVTFGNGVKDPHWHVVWVGIFATVQNHAQYLLMRPRSYWLPLWHQPGVILMSHIHYTVPAPHTNVCISPSLRKVKLLSYPGWQ